VTAGTGSEVGRAALITMNSGAKPALISPHMIPSVAVCDPELRMAALGVCLDPVSTPTASADPASVEAVIGWLGSNRLTRKTLRV
jgi:hypothetical protein